MFLSSIITLITKPFLAEEALERDNFLSPEEAKEFGLIDRVLAQPPSNDSNLQEKPS